MFGWTAGSIFKVFQNIKFNEIKVLASFNDEKPAKSGFWKRVYSKFLEDWLEMVTNRRLITFCRKVLNEYDVISTVNSTVFPARKRWKGLRLSLFQCYRVKFLLGIPCSKEMKGIETWRALSKLARFSLYSLLERDERDWDNKTLHLPWSAPKVFPARKRWKGLRRLYHLP